jgi:redox-sensitive bicupin YhaK (pirin superfamily)
MSLSRSVDRILQSHRQLEGAGFIVRRPFPAPGLPQVDPFLLLDEMGPIDYPPGEATGAPDHPHRGFETVTYLLEGETEHEDSAGHRGLLAAGGVQWMTAGDGVVHSEMPSARLQREGGRVHGFQLWVNLPRRDKRMPPRYQELPAARLPRATSADGKARVTVIAGEALGQRAVIETRTPISYLDWTLEPGAEVTQAVPAGHRGLAFVFGGAVQLGEARRVVKDGQLAILGQEGDALMLSVEAAAPGAARVLLLSGAPLEEPLARYGPFVMNTQQELEEAFEDYRAGRLGRIER